MKRWVVCKLELVDGNIEPAVARFTGNFRCWGPVDYAAGKWTLCQVGMADLTAINADSQCIVLPDLTLDATFGSLPSNVRNQIKTRLQGFGLSTSEILNTTTVREMLTMIGRINQPTMDPERGDVADF